MSRLSRFALLPLLIAVSALTLGTADTQARFNDLGHKLMCMCGCDQILLECDHIGCPDAAKESQELTAAIGTGESDTAVMEAFQAEYGPTVLAAPWLSRFNIVAWVVPPALLLIGLFGTFALVRKWRLRAASMPVVPNDPASRDLRERIRKETQL
jgi:cytochrome c-type biogenesis protein CcmH/NrfF